MCFLFKGVNSSGGVDFTSHIIAQYLFIYLFTQGKPKQLTLVFIGALHTFHVVTNMYVQFKHNTIQSNLREHDAY